MTDNSLSAEQWAQESRREELLRLAVFPADFSAEAGRRIAGFEESQVGGWVERQIVRKVGDERWLLEDPWQAFLTQKLEEHPKLKHSTEESYAGFYLELLQRAAIALQDEASVAPEVEALEQEWPHLEKAWRWATQRARLDMLVKASFGLYLFSLLEAYTEEGYGLFEQTRRQLLDLPGPSTSETQALPPGLCRNMARILGFTASLAEQVGEAESAWGTLERARALLQGIEAPWIDAFLRYLRFQFSIHREKWEQADALSSRLTEGPALQEGTWLARSVAQENQKLLALRSS